MALSDSYDIVLNGNEVGGGSIRIHRRDVQERIFRCWALGEAEARGKFGLLLDALEYGAPPHGGIAFGLDRLVMLLRPGQHPRRHRLPQDPVRGLPAHRGPGCPLPPALRNSASNPCKDRRIHDPNKNSALPSPTVTFEPVFRQVGTCHSLPGSPTRAGA